MKEVWISLRSGDCTDEFPANSTTNFFLRICGVKHKKHHRREHGVSKEEFSCTELIFLRSKTYCCYNSQSNKCKISSKCLNERTLEDCGDDPMSKYLKVLEKVVNLTSGKRDFRNIQHAAVTYEQTKKRLSYFYPEGKVEHDRRNTHRHISLKGQFNIKF